MVDGMRPERIYLAGKKPKKEPKQKSGACSNPDCFMYWIGGHSLGFTDRCPFCHADWEEVADGGRKRED
jgi:hypothetical protein